MPTSADHDRLGPAARRLHDAIAGAPPEHFVLRLFVSGLSARSQRAIDNIKQLCETHLAGRYDLRIIDLYQQPEFAKDHQLFAAPTLIKKLPLPLRKLVGDMNDGARVLVMLGVTPKNGKLDR
ncbi:MAG TPA: circadian clock KaiB family protein [Steroidobacteraceae bacterium]|nr:circadian clock KaiB family protein [Steroidobacteraceae bacterium]